jgi:acetyl esterase
MLTGGSKPFLEKCNVEKLVVDGTKYGSDWKEIPVFRCTPKDMEDPSKAPAIIFFHGSAFVLWEAEPFNGDCCHIATLNNAVVYNVDYRKAFETKWPKPILDCYAATKFILAE